MKKLLIPFLLIGLFINASVLSKQLVEFDNIETKQRYESLLEELRCLVCQNQSLSDSNADLAGDLRDEVERMLREGKTDDEIRDFMVSRYGDFVLYEPPLKTSTVLLWFAPFISIGVLAVFLVFFLIRRNEQNVDAMLDEARRKRAAALLESRVGNNMADKEANKE